MPTKTVYYVDASHPWHPSNRKNEHATIDGTRSIENTRKRKPNDYDVPDKVESSAIDIISLKSREEDGGGRVQQGPPSRKVARKMNYNYTNENVTDNNNDNDSDSEYVDSSDDELSKHEKVRKRRIKEEDDEESNSNMSIETLLIENVISEELSNDNESVEVIHDEDQDDDEEFPDNDDNDEYIEARTVQVRKKRVYKTFDAWFKELEAFKEKNGHCNVPRTRNKNPDYYSLGLWCKSIRQVYRGNRRGRCKLTTANITALEGIGFQLTSKNIGTPKSFDAWFKELEAFKEKNGHCNVPRTRKKDAEYYSLGIWCHNIRQVYRGNRGGRCNLPTANITALEGIGFQLTSKNKATRKSFEDWFKELVAFKNENGHCNVPRTRKKGNKYKALGVWCYEMRKAYKIIKKGEKPDRRLTDGNIQELEKLGFRFSV